VQKLFISADKIHYMNEITHKSCQQCHNSVSCGPSEVQTALQITRCGSAGSSPLDVDKPVHRHSCTCDRQSLPSSCRHHTASVSRRRVAGGPGGQGGSQLGLSSRRMYVLLYQPAV